MSRHGVNNDDLGLKLWKPSTGGNTTAMECDEKSALGTTAKMWGFFYEYEVVTTTCVAAGVFTTMCAVHNGVNLCLKDDLMKGDCIFTQHELLTIFFFTYL